MRKGLAWMLIILLAWAALMPAAARAEADPEGEIEIEVEVEPLVEAVVEETVVVTGAEESAEKTADEGTAAEMTVEENAAEPAAEKTAEEAPAVEAAADAAAEETAAEETPAEETVVEAAAGSAVEETPAVKPEAEETPAEEAITEETIEEEEAAPLRIPEDAEVLDHLDVGNPTPLRGNFFTDMWGNATSDIDVRDLIHGYDLIIWNGEVGAFAPNPSVVQEITGILNENGDHIYLIALQNDLYWSDGTPITAWDYAFSWLLSVAPEIQELGGRPHRAEYLKGYDAYMDGSKTALEGIRVIAENELLITIDAAYLPYFFELGLLDCQPYPIGEIAPGVRVADDGNGVYLTNANPAATEPVFTAELLRETILNPETGYMSHPRVVSGPYTITSWDGEKAEFALNPWYKGNEEDIPPVIGTLTYRTADNEDMIDRLTAGEFGLLDKVVRKDNIDRGMALVGTGEYGMDNYPRIGLSYISFAKERAAMADQSVRQAIAWCLDRDEMTAEYTGNYGIRVDGYYGIGQWMYGVIMGTITPEQPEDTPAEDIITPEMWDELNLDNLTVYTKDTERAARILEEGGWRLNADGVREKEIDGETVTLNLKMIYPKGNNIYEWFEENLIPNLESVGIRLEMEAVAMSELLGRWYGQAERDCDMLYLASDFDLLFDPAAQFVEGTDGERSWYYTGGTDAELYELALNMDRTEPGRVYEYMTKWIQFQELFNETLPMLPCYSNVYFDFFTANLHDYSVAEETTWSQAVVESALYIAPEAPEEELGGEEEEEEFEDDGEYEEFD